jgi:hypothetical protein
VFSGLLISSTVLVAAGHVVPAAVGYGLSAAAGLALLLRGRAGR